MMTATESAYRNYVRVLRMFRDGVAVDAPLSIHALVERAINLGLVDKVGDFMGPSAACTIAR